MEYCRTETIRRTTSGSMRGRHFHTSAEHRKSLGQKRTVLSMIHIYMTKAFRVIKRGIIWQSQNKQQIETELPAAVKNLYRNIINHIRTHYKISKPFKRTEGMKIGEISLVPFINPVDDLIREYKKTFKKYYIGWNRMTSVNVELFVFAYDIYGRDRRVLKETYGDIEWGCIEIWTECELVKVTVHESNQQRRRNKKNLWT